MFNLIEIVSEKCQRQRQKKIRRERVSAIIAQSQTKGFFTWLNTSAFQKFQTTSKKK